MVAIFRFLGVVLAGSLLAGIACAAEPEARFDGTVAFAVKTVSSTALPGGRRLDRVRLSGVIKTNEPWALFHDNVLGCSGTAVMDDKGAEIEAAGSCTAVDEDGDVWSLWYHNKDKARVWSVIGGTGKYTGMTGGGSMAVMGQAAGEVMVSWGATIRFE